MTGLGAPLRRAVLVVSSTSASCASFAQCLRWVRSVTRLPQPQVHLMSLVPPVLSLELLELLLGLLVPASELLVTFLGRELSVELADGDLARFDLAMVYRGHLSPFPDYLCACVAYRCTRICLLLEL